MRRAAAVSFQLVALCALSAAWILMDIAYRIDEEEAK